MEFFKTIKSNCTKQLEKEGCCGDCNMWSKRTDRCVFENEPNSWDLRELFAKIRQTQKRNVPKTHRTTSKCVPLKRLTF